VFVTAMRPTSPQDRISSRSKRNDREVEIDW
jgi:hypothetical protein